ncbi:ribonuclease HII [Methylosarcina fibrata]|uniref:ribonuclease HII n=1 Tax=Methylosarcina fibrata TaxID=105972 RepID=UPI0003620DD9
MVAGVDEAGRGPLAGPVVAAAVILDPARPIAGLADSKLISEKKRQTLFHAIQERSVAWSVAESNVEEIDRLNILQATLLAMQRAVHRLPVVPDCVLIDGNALPVLPMPTQAIVRGDRTVPEISAASIVAKVYRDELMRAYSNIYPDFSFQIHKGYGTQKHLAEIEKFGPVAVHRKSFRPVKEILENNNS